MDGGRLERTRRRRCHVCWGTPGETITCFKSPVNALWWEIVGRGGGVFAPQTSSILSFTFTGLFACSKLYWNMKQKEEGSSPLLQIHTPVARVETWLLGGYTHTWPKGAGSYLCTYIVQSMPNGCIWENRGYAVCLAKIEFFPVFGMSSETASQKWFTYVCKILLRTRLE